MTLHSVASLYPEQPTPAEKQLVSTWLDMFRDTITCHSCRSHFTEMYGLYRQKFPTLFNSRQELIAFTFRAHNTVNRRLNKPVYGTVAECMEVLHHNVQHRTATDYRVAYLNHIRRYWRSMNDVNGIVAMKKVLQMTQIELDYFAPRDTNFEVDIEETAVVLPRGIIESVEESSMFSRRRQRTVPQPTPSVMTPVQPPRALPSVGFRFTASGLRLR